MQQEQPHLVRALDAVGQRMKVDAAAAGLITHRASKGREREAGLLMNYLEPYLPRVVAIKQSAEIIDSTGAVSPECDLVIIDPRTPPLQSDRTFSLIFSECAYGVIEVKSHLDSDQLTDAVEKARKIKSLTKTAFHPQGDIHYPIIPTLVHVFAYQSIALGTLARKLRKLQEHVPVEHRIDGVFVLDKGLIIYRDEGDEPAIHCKQAASPIIVVEADNPLVAMTLMIQGWYGAVSSPRFRILDYLHAAPWGEQVDVV